MKKEIALIEKSLRQKAEEMLLEKDSTQITKLLEADSLKLMHEMEVYRIELEMQNDELQKSKEQDAIKMKLLHELELHKLELEMQNEEINRARIEAEEIANKYSLLYDFAPTGYFTLTNEGDILNLNLCGAQILGKDRSKLINSRFGFFVSNSTKPFFQLFLDKVFVTKAKEICEITILVANQAPIFAHLTGIAENEFQCLVTLTDISKRKQVEDELLLKNMIFDTSIAANSIADNDGIIIEANHTFYLSWGYKSKYEVIGKSLVSFFVHDYEADLILKSLKETGQWEGEFLAKRVNNSIFYAYAIATVVRDKYDEIIGYQSSVIDITERKQAEEALHVSEEKFRSIFENTQDIFFQIDLSGNIIDISPSIELFTKISRKNHIGTSILLSHDGSQNFEMLFDSILNNKNLSDFEIEIMIPDGTIKYVSVNAKLIFDNNGNPKHIDGSMRDVTQRKLTEDKLKNSQLLLHSSIESPKDMLIISVDTNYNHLIFNEHYKELMKNIYHVEVEIGMNLLDCITSDEDRIKSKRNLDKALAGIGHITIEEYGKFNKRYFETRYNPIINENNEIVGATFFAADITDRINTDRALKENEHKYRELVENSPDAIVIYIESEIVFGNRQALLLVGATSMDQLIGKSVLEFVHPSSHSVVIERMRNSSKETLPSAEEKFVKLDGSTVDVEVKATNIKIENKEAVQLIIRDISERKLAEKALLESETRFRKLLQEVEFVSIQGYAPDGTTQYWNHASELIYGYTVEEAIGKNLLDLIIPNEMKVGVKAAIEQMAETAIPIPASELKLKRKDGSLVSVYSYHTIVQVPGKPQELFCFDIDLTERILAEKALTESEENYRFMFDSNLHPMFIFDLETLIFLEVNQSAIKHYGYSREEFLSMTLKDIRPHEDLPALMKDLELVNDNIQTTTQWRHLKKNKELIYVEVTALTLNYKGKKARHILVNDITERKKIESALMMRQDELKNFAANLQNLHEEERLLLAREIHDELAQILVAVKIDMGIMKKSFSKNINNITVDGFLDNFNNIFSMVDNTIHTSRKIMSGLKSEVLELLGFIETVKLYSKEFEERHNIKCVLNLKEDSIELDPLKSIALFRIYQEILTDVSEHADATEVIVFLGIISDILIFEVTDNGNGFDINDIPKLEANALINMKERVYLLEGNLSITATPKKGTCVRVEMPYLRV